MHAIQKIDLRSAEEEGATTWCTTSGASWLRALWREDVCFSHKTRRLGGHNSLPYMQRGVEPLRTALRSG